MQLYPTPVNPLPPQADVFALKTRDGITLRAMKAGSGAGGKGTILLLGGRTEFLEKYFETISDFAARGFCVASFDWRGQGGSDRLLDDRSRGHVTSFKAYDEDLRTAVEDLLRARCPGPYYAIGHSTGGNVLMRNLIKELWFSRAILCAPLLELRYRPWPKWFAKLFAYVMVQGGLSWMFAPGQNRSHLKREAFEHVPLTSDRGRWDRDMTTLETFPHLAVGGPTLGWVNAAIESTGQLRKIKSNSGLRCPTMIVLAGREAVVDNRGALSFCERVPGLSLVHIRESLHEIMMERDVVRAQFFGAVDQFLQTG